MEKRGELSIGILYLSLHNSLCKVYGENRIIKRKDFFTKISKHYLVPKPLRHIVIKEMEQMNLIRCVNAKEILILKQDVDIEHEPVRFYELWKII